MPEGNIANNDLGELFMIDIDRGKPVAVYDFKKDKTHDDEPVKKSTDTVKIILKKKLLLISWPSMFALGEAKYGTEI